MLGSGAVVSDGVFSLITSVTLVCDGVPKLSVLSSHASPGLITSMTLVAHGVPKLSVF